MQGAEEKEGRLIMPDGRTVVPKALIRLLLKQLHETMHIGALAMARIVKQHYYAPGLLTKAQR